MYKKRFWVDTETTGTDARKNFMFQISYLIEENNNILLKRTLEMRPDNYEAFEFDADAEKVHKYPKEKIISFQSEKEAYKQLIADLEPFKADRLTIAGYTVDFDIKFIKQLFFRNFAIGKFKDYFDYMPFDIMQFVQGLRVAGVIELESIALEEVCKYLNIDITGAHHSMVDIVATKNAFDTLIKRIYAK